MMTPQLARLKKAINRLDYFGAPPHNSPLYVDEDNTFHEMLDKSEADGDDIGDSRMLTLGDLRQLIEEVEAL